MDDAVSITIASYEARATEYIDRTDLLAYFPDHLFLLNRFATLLPGPDVLDVGFGSGRDMLHFNNCGLHVVGIELTQAFLDGLCSYTDICTCKMDMRNLAFRDYAFDGVWCCASFLHLPRSSAINTLQGFYRVLREKGVLGITLKEGEGEEWVTSASASLRNAPRFFTYYHRLEIRQLLTECQFNILSDEIAENHFDEHHDWIQLLCVK